MCGGPGGGRGGGHRRGAGAGSGPADRVPAATTGGRRDLARAPVAHPARLAGHHGRAGGRRCHGPGDGRLWRLACGPDRGGRPVRPGRGPARR
ncbi:hypothetical protein THSYN_20505 [Candidatus Thiodictyon syntrophicum]|uniref:Uncharacterized protein n=1 Tax=Candidatus Thiodictyon syntrophicum TaxID=1166950 RepID=A0A2K8UBX0_9GAMM|nr:hypothetical protein THSYN_20505 [Candidatus Thiodictyon syntrophicum]